MRYATERGKGAIREVCGTINYLQPWRSSLVSRGLFSMSDVAAAGLRRNDPGAHDRQVKDGYIKGVAGAPAGGHQRQHVGGRRSR